MDNDTDKVIALTDGTVVRASVWSNPRPGPIGAEYLAEVANYGEVPLTAGPSYYALAEREYDDIDEDTHTIAAGYSASSRRE